MSEFIYLNSLDGKNYPAGYKMIVCNDNLLCHTDSDCVIFADEELAQWMVPQQEYLVGLYQQAPCYVGVIETADELPDQYSWRSLLSLLGKVSDSEFNWVGRAVQLVTSYRDQHYCGRCGGENQPMEKVHGSFCTNCDLETYPRISPCVIMLVTRGEECLLAKNKSWGEVEWYSALAGFIEPGECAEQTVHREVMEEVGVKLSSMEYIASQPWPFPGQLMLGYLAEFKSGELCPDETEISEAGWWRYDQLPPHPDQRTLSGRLIKTFVDRCHRQST